MSSVARMESEEAGPDLVAVWEVHLADGVHVIGKKNIICLEEKYL